MPRKRLNVFCSQTALKKKKEFPSDRTKALADSDKGSYFKQEVLLKDGIGASAKKLSVDNRDHVKSVKKLRQRHCKANTTTTR